MAERSKSYSVLATSRLRLGEALTALHRADEAIAVIEETGYRATEWARAGILHNAIAYSDEGIEVWFARGLVAGKQQLDAGEFLEVVTHSVEQLDAKALSGELTDAKTLIGLLWLQNWRAGRWPASSPPATRSRRSEASAWPPS